MKRKQWLPGWECSLADLADRGGGYIGVGTGQVVQRYPLLTAHHTSIKTFIRGHSKSYRDVAYAQKAPSTNQTKNRLQFPLPRHQHFSGFSLLQAHGHVFGALHSHRSVRAPTRVRAGPPQMARAPWLPGGPRRQRAESGAQRPRGAPCRPPHAHARTPQPPAPGSPPAAPSPAASSQSAPGEEAVPESSRREQAGTRFPCPPCGREGGRAPRDAQQPHSGRTPAAPRPHGDRGGASLRPGRRRRKSGPPARPPASRDALRGAT